MNQSLLVTKRDGTTERINLDKIHRVLDWAAEGLNNVSISQVELRSHIQFYDGIKTADIHETIIKAAADLISRDAPDYQYLAARLAIFHLRKKAFGQFEPPALYDHVVKMVEKGKYDHHLLEDYTEEERTRLFGAPPATVWENMQNFENYPAKLAVITAGGALRDQIIEAFRAGALTRWKTELIARIKTLGCPSVLVINKVDTLDKKEKLLEVIQTYEQAHQVQAVVPISAKTGMGIDNLLEMVALTAEVAELKANPNRAASGAVVEARLDKGRGPIATLLVQNGTLHQGDIIIAGTAVGRVRAMMSDKGQKLTTAGPSVPVEITGLGEVPEAGAHFNAVADERLARELVEQRKEEEKRKANAPITKVSLEDLFSQIQAGEMKNLNIIVKADVMGSVEAVKASLEKISNDEVRVRVIHGAVGAINESDVMLAATSNAIIVGFNVRPDAAARDSAARNHVDMRMYRVIYDAIDEIEAAMKGMLAPKFREAIIGHAEIRQTYKVSSVGTVAGCYVTDGKIQRACDVRIVRDGIVVHEGHLASLQRFKDSVKEVAQGYECGLSFEKYNDIKVGDIVEAYVMEQIEQ